MSTINEAFNQGNFAQFNRDTEKIFIFDNGFESGIFLNDTGADLDLKKGTVLGRIAASNRLVALDDDTAGADDGRSIVVGVLAHDVTIADTETEEVTMCIAGQVVESKVILLNSLTLTSVIGNRTVADKIKGETMGIKLREGQELTTFENQ